ncbi:MAG TPA: FCD domain-containing protein [Geminicoccaceae bacterium]|nr:FCD domain-containing protein [Geminicoccaceae bacterium]
MPDGIATDVDDRQTGHGRGRLSEQAYQQIHRLILRGEFPKDCKLPTESELGARLGVSRPVIREALARLREEGVVRSQQGSGTFVVRGTPPHAEFLPPIRTVADLLNSYDFRIHVEGRTAFLAAERHTRERLADIEQALLAAEAAIDGGAVQLALDLNFDFHRAVARATSNPFYVATIEAIPNLIGIARDTMRHFHTENAIERVRVIHEEHLGIFRAIRDRDGRRARAEMEAHIDNARRYVLERRELA